MKSQGKAHRKAVETQGKAVKTQGKAVETQEKARNARDGQVLLSFTHGQVCSHRVPSAQTPTMMGKM